MQPTKTLTPSLEALFPLIADALEAGSEALITVRGNSMRPFLQDCRDQAFLSPLKNRRIRRGDVVFYQRDSGQYVMHRILRIAKSGQMTLLGDAQYAPEEGIRPDQLRAFVPRVIRNGKDVSCERGLWHTAMTLYMLRIRFPRLARIALRAATRLHSLLRRAKNEKKTSSA